jgi:hypothetical protein
MSCKVANTYIRSDHKPIETVIDTSLVCTNPPPRRAFKKANTSAIKAKAQWLQLLVHELESAQDIDNYTEYLVGFIQKLIDYTVLYKATSTHAQA